MARAPETGFYFEPIHERLALVVEGSPFPSDDHWAWLGDPLAMTPEQAQLLVAVRWPGVDPAGLAVEFDLNFERAVQAAEEDEKERRAGVAHVPLEFDVDLDALLAQAEALRDQVREASLRAPSREADAAAAEAERLQALIAQARLLAEPNLPGRPLALAPAPAQSTSLLRGEALAPAARAAPSASMAPKPIALPAAPGAVQPLAVPDRAPRREPAIASSPGEPAPSSPAAAPRPAPKPAPKRPPEPERRPQPPEPEPKPGPRRPNIRDKR